MNGVIQCNRKPTCSPHGQLVNSILGSMMGCYCVVNARTPHTFSPFAQDSSSMTLGVMLGVHEERMRQSIEVMNSYIPTFSIDSEAFWLEDVESEGKQLRR